MLSKEGKKVLTEKDAVSSRIITAIFRTIHECDPTNDTDNSVKEG